MQNLAPIVLFVYNRPWHTKQTLNALMQNELADQSILYIYADGPKENASGDSICKINEVRKLIWSQKWCKEVIIIESGNNMGLANSIINGVTEILNKYEKIIVLEDDIVASRGFLIYMNEALNKYKNEDLVMQISGHMFPIKIKATARAILLPFTTSWGWGTWQKSWRYFDPIAEGYEVLKENKLLSYKFDLDGSYPYTEMLIEQMEQNSLNSWAIRWWWTVFKKSGLVVFPDKSLIKNIGFDGSGVHSGSNDIYKDLKWVNNYKIIKFPELIDIDVKKYLLLKSYFARTFTEIKFVRRIKFFESKAKNIFLTLGKKIVKS